MQWKAVIHDGRTGDGIDWVSLAYLPRNVAPVIDGIALQDPGVRAQGQSNIGANQPTVVTLKLPPSPNPTGVVITQSGAPAKFELPPQGTLQKGYQSVLWSAHDDNDDELALRGLLSRRKRTRVEIIEGQSRTEILFLGYHHAA